MSEQIFDPATVLRLRNQFQKWPEDIRPAILDVAVSSELDNLRNWIEDQFANFSIDMQRNYVTRLRDPLHFVQALSEIACSNALKRAGYQTEMEPKLAGLTPDLVARNDSGHAFIGEVWTRSIPKETTSHRRAWSSLSQQVGKVKTGLYLIITTSDPEQTLQTPNQAILNQIRDEVTEWLDTPNINVGDHFQTRGFRFWAAGYSGSEYAHLVPVTPHVTVDRQHIIDKITSKVNRYRHISNELALPILIIISAATGTGLSHEFLRTVLSGGNPLTFSFSIGTIGQMQSRPVTLLPSNDPPPFDSALSGVAWLDVNEGHDSKLTIWPSINAKFPFPALKSEGIVVEKLS